MATPTNIEAFEARRAELEATQAKVLADAKGRAAKLEGLSVTVTSRSGTEGKLFGSVGTDEIRLAISAQGTEVEKKEIRLPEGPLRVVGEHPVTVHLHTDVDVEVTINVVGEEE